MSDEIAVKVPEITPELIAANQEQQDLWAKQYFYEHPTHDSYAHVVIRGLLTDLDALVAASLSSDTPADEREIVKVRIVNIRRDLAAWMISIGNFKSALTFADDEHTQNRCRERIDAGIS